MAATTYKIGKTDFEGVTQRGNSLQIRLRTVELTEKWFRVVTQPMFFNLPLMMNC